MKNNNIKSYKDLIVWQKSMKLTEDIYMTTKTFPREETYGLTSQIKRSVVSIPSNIAEGSRRSTKKDFRQFILIAYGSGAELETQIEIALRCKFLGKEEYNKIASLLEEVMKMLNKISTNLLTTH